MILRGLFLFLFPVFIQAENLSYYKGYLLYKNYLEETSPSVDFNQVMEGMKAAHNGLIISNEEIEENKNKLYNQVKEERLSESNYFMAKVVLENGVIELIKGKLAYKIIKIGSGSEIEEQDSPLILYRAKTLVNGKQITINEIDEPKTILLKSTITGFLKGVAGMQEGEIRVLYIHPDFAYGSGSELIEPNSQMIIEVEVIEKHASK